MNADELAQAVAQEDVKRLSSAPGIGKKTAERMILELRGKLTHSDNGDLALFTPQNAPSQGEDIVSTLLALGYNEREARAAIKGIDTSDISEGVRLALKNLMK